METSVSSSAKVQHVTKKSSDELLRKFADDSGSEVQKKTDLRAAKRRKKSWAAKEDCQCESPSYGSTRLVERRSLLPPAATRRSAMFRQLGIGRVQLRARDVRNKFLFGTIEKTWRRTIEGASRVFMEKHYHRHKRLISDMA